MLHELRPTLSRRRFLETTGLAAAVAWLGTGRVGAFSTETQEGGLVGQMRREASHAKIEVQKLRGNVTVLMGSGGNIAVLDGKDEKFLVDAGMAGSQRQITEALAAMGAAPVRHVVNTHWHFDHTDGNQWLHQAGATIIAHENVRKRLSESTRVEPWDFTFAPSPADGLPTVTLRSAGAKDGAAGETLYLSGGTVRLNSYQPSHTDGDTVVEFPEADVVHLGDTWWNGHYPFIDYGVGGSIDGMIRAAESSLAMVGAKTIVVPGHGPVGGQAELREFRDMLATVRERVGVLKKQGKTLDEVVSAAPTAAFDAKWGTFILNGAFFTKLVYAGV